MKILAQVVAKKHEKAQEFQILHFYWSFSISIMAVKGLTELLLSRAVNRAYRHILAELAVNRKGVCDHFAMEPV